MDKKDKLLTIGRFAAMHGINKKTLMWYDEIGLFSPAAIHPQNGYRYYSYRQSPLLETILLLRDLDVPIKEIQAFVQDRSAKRLAALYSDKIRALDEELLHRNAIRQTLIKRRQQMLTLMQIDLTEIAVIEKEERGLVTVAIEKDISFEKEVELITAETEKYRLRRLHDASYGSMISVESLRSGAYDDYARLFIEISVPNDPSPKEGSLHIQPGGTYVRAFHLGGLADMPQKYQELFSFAQKRGLELHGFSYEMGINDNVIERIEDYIVQIEIPARPKR